MSAERAHPTTYAGLMSDLFLYTQFQTLTLTKMQVRGKMRGAEAARQRQNDPVHERGESYRPAPSLPRPPAAPAPPPPPPAPRPPGTMPHTSFTSQPGTCRLNTKDMLSGPMTRSTSSSTLPTLLCHAQSLTSSSVGCSICTATPDHVCSWSINIDVGNRECTHAYGDGCADTIADAMS